MVLYAVILFAVSALLGVLGLRIWRGELSLIHDYHLTNLREEDKPAYGRGMALGLWLMGAGFVGSGVASLVEALTLSLVLLGAGIAASLICLVRVQRKYNGKIM